MEFSSRHVAVLERPRVGSGPRRWLTRLGPEALVALVGAVVLLGWLVHLRPLESFSASGAPMKPNSAFEFVLCGLALWLLEARPSGRKRLLARAGAALVTLLALLTLAEYAFGWNLRIDQLLAHDPLGGTAPGRPSANTALCFALAGLSLLCLDLDWRLFTPTQICGTVISAVAFAATLGSAYQVPRLETGFITREITAMPLVTALPLLVFVWALLHVRPSAGVMRLATSPAAGGVTIRRLFPAAIAIPALIGFVCLKGEEAGLYGPKQGIALFALASAGAFAALIWVTARSLERLDVERSRANLELAERHHAAAWQAAIVESSDDAIVGKTLDGTIVSWNHGAERLYGYSAEEIVGRNVSVLAPPERLDESLGILAELGRGLRVAQIETERLAKDGKRLQVSLTASPVVDAAGESIGASAITRDISERKAAEEAIRRLNEELEERVRVRTAQLEAANHELEAFSYSVSHDLRAPLRAIDGFSRLLSTEHADDLPPDAQRYLGLVTKSTEEMGSLIDGLLAFSRLGQQQLAKRSVDVETLARQVVAELDPLQAGRAVEISIGALPAAEADTMLLKQVLVNLVSNALKFTREREEARIEVDSYEDEGVPVYFVRDNGVGFDSRYAHKLFAVFQRLHRLDEFEGTGLGLALVARIVTRHGGRIWAEGHPGAGATFYFTLKGGEG